MKSVMLSIMFVAVAMISNEAKAQAKMDFKKEVHDYGNIKNGANGTCIFEFTNTGNAPLIISNAAGSCGCTVPTWPKEPIAPGAKGEITVKYDTKRTGEFTKTVTLTSNGTEASKVLTIKGNVAAPVEGASPVNTSGAPIH
jgi:hypothetical protein